jgi:hypothetical protein
LYTAVVGVTAASASAAAIQASKQLIILLTLQYKHIFICHKREIIVVQGTKTMPQKS